MKPEKAATSRSRRLHYVELTSVEIDHILTLLANEESYYGPRDQYEQRKRRIMDKLERSISHGTVHGKRDDV